jgi:hypothetical protein
MIRDSDLVRRFEDEESGRTPPDHAANLAVVEALWEEARRLGVVPSPDPLEGIESDIRLAGALNVRKPS